jgi:hypothetical protein
LTSEAEKLFTLPELDSFPIWVAVTDPRYESLPTLILLLGSISSSDAVTSPYSPRNQPLGIQAESLALPYLSFLNKISPKRQVFKTLPECMIRKIIEGIKDKYVEDIYG